MRLKLHILAVVSALLAISSGCATYYAEKVGPTPIMLAEEEIPEDQLLDVGILVFKSEAITEQQAQDQGTNNDIRKAERYFIPYHLKYTLQQSGQWGAVQVIPAEADSVDLVIDGQILESNGQYLGLKIEAVDATGRHWFKKNYKAEATDASYRDIRPGEKDAFQDVYNAIANDLAEFKMKLPPGQIDTIRTTAKLKFAEEFAPAAFKGYLAEDKNNELSIKRLPADDDPMLDRLLKIREREYMYVDTLNEYYREYYAAMWSSYGNWRKLNYEEIEAISKIERSALKQKLLGALLVAGAIALNAGEVKNTGALQVGMILIGGQVIVNGFNVTKEAQIHSAAIKELSESFGSEMKPIVMEFEGKQYELTGSAQEQFKHWRELLRQIYITETGFDSDILPEDKEKTTSEDSE